MEREQKGISFTSVSAEASLFAAGPYKGTLHSRIVWRPPLRPRFSLHESGIELGLQGPIGNLRDQLGYCI